MASWCCILILYFLFPLSPNITTNFASGAPTQLTNIYPFPCSDHIKTCSAFLYQHNSLSKQSITKFYSINASAIEPISYDDRQDYLVTVPCTCKDVDGTVGYFYDTSYKLQLHDTFANVSNDIYSGQAWKVRGEEMYQAGDVVTMHLLCGCVEDEEKTVVTYTIQQHDTLSSIGDSLSSQVSDIENLNPYLTSPHPQFVDVGWLIYVPMYKNGVPALPSSTGKKHKAHKWTVLVGILSAVTVLSICTVMIFIHRRKRWQRRNKKDPAAISKSFSTKKTMSLQKKYMYKDHTEDMPVFESERQVIYSLEEIAEATSNFDESGIIGQGGYGSVYYGRIGKQEVAIKKMRSNKSKEFIAELKVLCKIHHINVVELLGYASGDDHLYLVYEYVLNGSLNEHLHQPMLKGHKPLSWTTRTQIALDTARGIEYIHDHTKSRYVHRDIKTSNILLDEAMRAKVADFGLAKLVGRTNEDEFLATRLVGTPGYLPPESVKELQITTKTDVFAFGVVLAELITGKRALIRENGDPNKMKSLISIIHEIFQDEDPESTLESFIDENLSGYYPMEDIYKMAEIADWCLSENAINRPEIREVVVALSQIRTSSTEWEASLGGDSMVFSGVFNGR
ncbi:lysM domain receptor-like kinase 3 [Lycium ferocissimum]|uniref:lysM domain receptor-like kinase 3 n=1 Tax=Lycium ferocissimum TaxID=112874 RepID=UPI002815CFA8|nr:lysM domain receptor-like kinase 3 [Lycium ferocissimum]